MEQLTIRCSSLSAWNDCPRRGAAKLYKVMVENAGYRLNPQPKKIYTVFGSALHKGIETFMLKKIEKTNMVSAIASSINNAVQFLTEELGKDNYEWDNITDGMTTAEKQLEEMICSFCNTNGLDIFPIVNPEYSMTASVGKNVDLSGTVDLISIKNRIYDYKTTSSGSSYHGQFGGYSMLHRAEFHKSPSGLSVLIFPRKTKKKPFSGIKEIEYDIASCEKYAYRTIIDITKSMQKFEEVQKPEVFACNPMSRMCSKNFCPAFNTAFCDLHKENDDDGSELEEM
jgi:hypothetical protein